MGAEADRVSRNFRRGEYACRCGCGFGLGEGDIDPRLVELVQGIRDRVGVALTINSGCRCRDHNAAVGGAAGSQHLRGRAADLRPTVRGACSLVDIVGAAEALLGRGGGIKRYKTFVHVDVREGRWRG